MYLTFRPAKGSTVVPKLLRWLSTFIDVFLLLLMTWIIVNLCYPFWGWVMYASIWTGFIPYGIFSWIIKRLSIRTFIASRHCPDDRLVSDGLHNLKHCGFLFSVWEKPNSLVLGYYNKNDQVNCLRKRFVILGHEREYNKWLGWLIVLSTDAIPLAFVAALPIAGYFFGVGAVVFFLMGFVLAEQLFTIGIRFGASHLWKEKMFLDGKVCTIDSLGAMMCVLEGPDNQLFLTLQGVLMFNHYVKRPWFASAARMPCPCCRSLIDPILIGLENCDISLESD
jgi:hypothetical protein